jgi:hypothetical protein
LFSDAPISWLLDPKRGLSSLALSCWLLRQSVFHRSALPLGQAMMKAAMQ